MVKLRLYVPQKALCEQARSICFSLDGDTLFIGNDNANNYVANPVAVGMVTRKGGFKDLKSYIPSEKLAQPLLMVSLLIL